MISDQLRALRKMLNLSQKKFGEKLNVSQSLINALENSDRMPTVRFIDDVCRTFKVNRAWLMDGVEPMYDDPLDELNIEDEVKELTTLLMQLDEAERESIMQMIQAFKNK